MDLLTLSIVGGLIAANIVALAHAAHKFDTVMKRLEAMERVGVLVTGEQSTTAAPPKRRMSRVELRREIEKRAALVHGG
jgi:hypothetical protein